MTEIEMKQWLYRFFRGRAALTTSGWRYRFYRRIYGLFGPLAEDEEAHHS